MGPACWLIWIVSERYARVYEQAGVAGWLTTAGSKPEMVSRMGALLVESPWMFFSRRLLGECRTFVAMAGGRTGAANGAHDDCLMAMAIAQAVRAELMSVGDDVLPDGRTALGGVARRNCRGDVCGDGLALLGGDEPGHRQGRGVGSTTGIHVTKWPRSAQEVRPAGHGVYPACGGFGLAVLAVQAIRRMRGGAQSQLMLGADGKLWVVKFQNNPQHRAGAGE